LEPGRPALAAGCGPWLYRHDERAAAGSTRRSDFFSGWRGIIQRQLGGSRVERRLAAGQLALNEPGRILARATYLAARARQAMG
jgi:hypothetical protein